MRSSLSGRKEILSDSSSSSSSSSSSDSDSSMSDRAEHALDAVLSDSSSSSSSSSDGECKHHKKSKKETKLQCERHGKYHVCRYTRAALPADPARISVKHVTQALPDAAAALAAADAAMQELTVADEHDDAAAAIGTAEQQARIAAIRARPLGAAAAAGDALAAAADAKQPVPGLKPIGRRQHRSARTGRYAKAAAPAATAMPGLRPVKAAGAKGDYLQLSDDDAPDVSSDSDSSSSSSSSSDSDDADVRRRKLAEEDEYNQLYNRLAEQLGSGEYVNALITRYQEKHPLHADTLRHGKYAFKPLDYIDDMINHHGVDYVREKAAAYYSGKASRIVDNQEARYAKHLPTPNSTHLSARVGAKATASRTAAMPGLVPISSAPTAKKSAAAAAKPAIRVKGAAASSRRAVPAKAAISDAY